VIFYHREVAINNLFLGIDIGSISVKAVLLDGERNVLKRYYRRMLGKPLPVLENIILDIEKKFPGQKISRCGTTGTGGELAASIIGAEFFNEVVAHSTAIAFINPEIKTVIEMGGQDSKFITMKPTSNGTKSAVLEDFAMNTACAAGTGSFLDQQASRMNYTIEEFADMSLKSKKPPRVAGRCSVFAKSDMIHLQQVGTPDFDIAAGLCYAVARSFKANVAQGKLFTKPIAFIGGVAANVGVVKAFEDELELENGELLIPELHKEAGALGAAIAAMNSSQETAYLGHAPLNEYLNTKKSITGSLDPLTGQLNDSQYSIDIHSIEKGTEVYIGIDIGSLSTNVVAIDGEDRVVARRYLRTQSRPIEAVTKGLLEIGEEIGDKVIVKGVGTTGSGRYMIGDFVGADEVRNEITAQATAAVHFIPDADTIFEIGGQDSKYISLNNGVVIDFEMNKVCAAGTGSFIEEQAERLGLDIKKDFSDAAFDSQKPGSFGERCTVFIESDLVSHQQKGAATSDLAAGLAYSIVKNYLQVVGDRIIGEKVLFQGGVAWNKAVISAFEAVTGKKIHIPPHHDVTGAIGAAIIARRSMVKKGNKESRFIGFDLRNRTYKLSTFECKACDNVCGVSRVKFEGEAAHYHGARCELFEKDKKKKENDLPDLFAEREQMIFGQYASKKEAVRDKKKVVGIPRILFTYELFPFFKTFLEEIGCEVVLSGRTNQEVINTSLEYVTAETCFPIKIIHGHVIDLIDKKVDVLFMPSIVTLSSPDTKFNTSKSCPLIQAHSYIAKTAVDLKKNNVELWEPPIHFQRGDASVANELAGIGKKMGVSQTAVERAVRKGRKAQNEFYSALRNRGTEVIDNLRDGQRAVVIISRPYNGCDNGINMDLPKKLKDMGVIAVPMDMLSLPEDPAFEVHPNMYWRSGQRFISAAETIRKNPRLNAIYISNFKCGPDSFISYHVTRQMNGKPFLHLEVDEHSADAGAITRCEAFFDSLENVDNRKYVDRTAPKPIPSSSTGFRKVLYLPYMCDHAYPLAAALRSCGQDSEVLPKTDRVSLEIGRKYSSGKECIPYTLTTGDIVKKVMKSDFNPGKSIFFMPGTNGPCRFGQYNSTLRILLDKLGHEDTELMSAEAEGAYGGFEHISPDFRRIAWRGILATDIIQKLLHETRPYETIKGSANSAYDTSLKIIEKSVENGGKDIFKRILDIREIFRSVPVDKSERRPIIGIVGEIYVRFHPFSNQHIIEQIEELGGEAWLAPFSEWILYCTDRFIANGKKDRNLKDIFSGQFFHAMQKADEKKLVEPFKKDLLNWHEPSTKEVLALSRPYLEATFEGESILSIGKAIDYAHKGCSGIINLLPFSCMPGTVVTALSKKVRDQNGNIPWLNIDYDGMDENNGRSRLEAFIFQAGQFCNQKNDLGKYSSFKQ